MVQTSLSEQKLPSISNFLPPLLLYFLLSEETNSTHVTPLLQTHITLILTILSNFIFIIDETLAETRWSVAVQHEAVEEFNTHF